MYIISWGIRGITLDGFPLDVTVKVNMEESPSISSHLRGCTTEASSEVVKEESPSVTHNRLCWGYNPRSNPPLRGRVTSTGGLQDKSQRRPRKAGRGDGNLQEDVLKAQGLVAA